MLCGCDACPGICLEYNFNYFWHQMPRNGGMGSITISSYHLHGDNSLDLHGVMIEAFEQKNTFCVKNIYIYIYIYIYICSFFNYCAVGKAKKLLWMPIRRRLQCFSLLDCCIVGVLNGFEEKVDREIWRKKTWRVSLYQEREDLWLQKKNHIHFKCYLNGIYKNTLSCFTISADKV